MSLLARRKSVCLMSLSTAHRGAASATWFGKEDNVGSLTGTLRALLGSLCGIALINLWFRGNIVGKANTESEVYIPLSALRSHVPEPSTYGFVDSSSDNESAAVVPGKK